MRAMALALLPAAVLAHPAIVICQDPRLREGGLIMHHWVTANQYTTGIDITASALSYKEGDTIDISVKNLGSAPYNNSFIAVQATSFCTMKGDHGKFTDLSSDLAATTGCDSGIYSNTPTPFTGSSTAKWTAGPETTGPVTLKLVWGNGPASSDPLAVSGIVRVPDTYLYIKTLTLNYTGPTPACPAISPTPAPAPHAPGHSGKCVNTDCKALEGVGSPVFVQTLPQEASQQTFPSGRCLPCRVDHRHTCKSAKVECPSSWKQTQLVEKIWTKNKNCSGEPDRIVRLPSTHAHCPGADHYSADEDKLDMERFVPKLQRDHPSYFPDVMTARDAIREYRRMLTVAQRFPGTSVVPSKLVDLVWHEHILDTKTYRRDTLRMFGEYIHHNPSFGGAEEKEELVHEQQAMFKNYAAIYGEAPPAKTWPQPAKVKVGAGNDVTPDCCSSQCAKPNCHNCVGCNSVDCGYRAESTDTRIFKLDTELSPEAAAGYVPISRIAADLARAETSLKCSVTPQAEMKLDWAICGDQIYFEQSLNDVQGGWYALGLSDKIPLADMSGADYVLTFPTGNYSGVKDAYRWAPGNGYPCFDIEYECSAGNATKGTYDLRNGKIVRQNGVTTSTWSRALKTPDYKDTEIANHNVSVLFARGGNDFFYYHNGDRNVCIVNFFTGLLDCQPQRIDPGKLPDQPH